MGVLLLKQGLKILFGLILYQLVVEAKFTRSLTLSNIVLLGATAA